MKRSVRAIFSSLVPRRAKLQFREWRINRARALKVPQMIWGYRDASGKWRTRTRISDTAFIYHSERVFVEEDVFVWHYTILDGTGGLEIMEGAQIGAWVGIFTHSSHIAIRLYGRHYHEVPESKKAGYSVEPVSIGRYTAIGARATILPGVRIGQGALVTAGSIVNRNVGDFQVVSGVPARIAGDTRKLDAKFLDDPQIRAWWEEWQEK